MHIEFKVQKVSRGLVDAFILGEDFIDDKSVTMILGDNIFEDNLSDKIKSFDKRGLVFAKEVFNLERFGVVEFDKGENVILIEEKPKKLKCNFCVIGVYTFDNNVVEIAKSLKPLERGEVEVTDINKEYLKRGKLNVQKINGEWLDAGTFNSLWEANIVVKEKEIYKNMDLLINEAIRKFNEELKNIAKKRLI